MRALILGGLMAVAAGTLLAQAKSAPPPAEAGPPSLIGSWLTDATGERIDFARKDQDMTVTIPGVGTGTVTPDKAAQTFTIYIKTGLFSSLDCTYSVAQLGPNRLGLTVVKGDAKCPRGAVSRIEGQPEKPVDVESAAKAVKPPPEPPKEAVVQAPPPPPQEPPQDLARGRPVRSLEQLSGRWVNVANGEALVFRSTFSHSWEMWQGSAGQAGISPLPDNPEIMQVSYPTGRGCTFSATHRGDQIQITRGKGECGLAGIYKRD